MSALEWVGSICGIVSPVETDDYELGEWEPCVLCEHDRCRAVVRKFVPSALGTSLAIAGYLEASCARPLETQELAFKRAIQRANQAQDRQALFWFWRST